MKRITMSLPEDLAKMVEYEAEARRTSVSEVIRDAIIAVLSPSVRRVSWAGICDDGELPRAADIDEELEREWPDVIDRDR
ncbi:MAG: ribbon-helix-helix domain-containing protein [Acidobacteria bacterium]|nr:ribbon-helix-helix domain-containing protein [Acidobacteriota bacterium]